MLSPVFIPVTMPDGSIISDVSVSFEESEKPSVSVREFVEYEDIPCAIAVGGRVFRIFPNPAFKDDNRSFPVVFRETVNGSSTEALLNGSTITLEEVIELAKQLR